MSVANCSVLQGPVAPSSLFVAEPAPPCPPAPPCLPAPPPPPPAFPAEDLKPDNSAAQRSALFAQLNQGEAITKGVQEKTFLMR